MTGVLHRAARVAVWALPPSQLARSPDYLWINDGVAA